MIHSHTLVEYIVHVREVLTLLTKHCIQAKCAKCAWACRKVHFCGFDIDMDSIQVQKHKTCAVSNWAQSENSKDIRGFLGLSSYYGQFIECYTHIATLLYATGILPNWSVDVGSRHGELRTIICSAFGLDSEWQHAFDTLKHSFQCTSHSSTGPYSRIVPSHRS